MRYRLMGKSGLRVSELGLGAMTFGTEGWGVEKEESRRVFDGFREAAPEFGDVPPSSELEGHSLALCPCRGLPGLSPKFGSTRNVPAEHLVGV